MVFWKKKRVGKNVGGGGAVGEHKFCPVCGHKLERDDTFCVKCSYSFSGRFKKVKKKTNWSRIVIVIVLLLVAYFALRYFSGATFIPRSLPDALSTLFPN